MSKADGRRLADVLHGPEQTLKETILHASPLVASPVWLQHLDVVREWGAVLKT